MPRVKKLFDPNRTPDSIIKSALRLVFLRSRERAAAIRRDSNTCQTCGAKGSQAKGKEVKIEVHHLQEGDISWDKIYKVIREELLCKPEIMMSLCKAHHYEIHGKVLKPKVAKQKNTNITKRRTKK